MGILFFCLQVFAKDVHPYHVGSVEISYNSKSKTFEITGRFFLDDLENALSKKYGKSFHFNDAKYKSLLNETLKSYCAEYLKLKTNNKFLKVDYLGYEEDNESVNIFLESESVDHPKKVETAVSFLYNLFDDQINIVHIIVNGERKSEKLTYPDRYLYKQF
ncbi:hypothetical protein MUU74_07895 [Chryseobacterium daecheongense]|uniref:DUF6702 family protein n=1 Tax=Chryseobacterium daecheongense TaxID=192389 RepID=UPI001FD669AE|nr:DUF6702 family protein [Chryseobacterium daecheongense]UOU99862.1 hypothetical protein MUU74_07895 [Chryseobacterium daecheongense]